MDKSFGRKEMRAYALFKNKVPFKAEPRGDDPAFWSALLLQKCLVKAAEGRCKGERWKAGLLLIVCRE